MCPLCIFEETLESLQETDDRRATWRADVLDLVIWAAVKWLATGVEFRSKYRPFKTISADRWVFNDCRHPRPLLLLTLGALRPRTRCEIAVVRASTDCHFPQSWRSINLSFPFFAPLPRDSCASLPFKNRVFQIRQHANSIWSMCAVCFADQPFMRGEWWKSTIRRTIDAKMSFFLWVLYYAISHLISGPFATAHTRMTWCIVDSVQRSLGWCFRARLERLGRLDAIDVIRSVYLFCCDAEWESMAKASLELFRFALVSQVPPWWALEITAFPLILCTFTEALIFQFSWQA